MNRLTEVVKNLLIINVIFFLGQLILQQHIDTSMGYLHFPLGEGFMPLQLITSMFMHADFGHLFFNMISLFFLGPMVEQTLGPKRFLVLYLTAGLVGSLAHVGIDYIQYVQMSGQIEAEMLAQIKSEGYEIINQGKNYTDPLYANFNLTLNGRSLGASGAVYGVVIAFVTMFPKMKLMVFPLPIPIPAAIVGIFMVGYGVVSGIGQLQPNIAHFAHLGGALVGFLMVHYWKMANLR